MAKRNNSIETDDRLYQKYTELTPQQIEYIKIKSNPETKINKKTEAQIAKEIGISERQVYNWKNNPEIRKAIIKESMMKSADDLPIVLNELYNIATSPIGGSITAAAKVSAIKIWLNAHGFLDASEQDLEPKQKTAQTFEERILKLSQKAENASKIGDIDEL